MGRRAWIAVASLAVLGGVAGGALLVPEQPAPAEDALRAFNNAALGGSLESGPLRTAQWLEFRLQNAGSYERAADHRRDTARKLRDAEQALDARIKEIRDLDSRMAKLIRGRTDGMRLRAYSGLLARRSALAKDLDAHRNAHSTLANQVAAWVIPSGSVAAPQTGIAANIPAPAPTPEQVLARFEMQAREARAAHERLKKEFDDATRELLGEQRDVSPGEIARQMAEPARVDFSVDTRMAVGERYEIRLAIGEEKQTGEIVPAPRVSTDVAVTDRARATLRSAQFDIKLLTEEWQRVDRKAPAVWIWRVQPTKHGEQSLLVSVQHAVRIKGTEHQFTVRHFPQRVFVQVGWWEHTRLVLAGIPPAAQGAAAVVTAVGAVGGCVWAWWTAWHKRKRPARPAASRSRAKGQARRPAPEQKGSLD